MNVSNSTNTKPYKIFCSYQWSNRDFVFNMCDRLSNEYEIWVDRNKMQRTDDYFVRMEEGISESDVFLAFISRRYCQSPYCQREIRYANQQDKKYLYVILEEGLENERSAEEIALLTAGKKINLIDEIDFNNNWSENLVYKLKRRLNNLVNNTTSNTSRHQFDDLTEEIICKACNQQYNLVDRIPYVTTCSKFKYICSKCVSDRNVFKYRSSFEYSKFTCPYDGVEHYQHLNVKDLNKIRIIKFLDLEENMKNKLNEFETTFFEIEEKNENEIFELEDTIENLKFKIKTKVNKLKEQIKMKTEVLIDELISKSNAIMTEVDGYKETLCKEIDDHYTRVRNKQNFILSHYGFDEIKENLSSFNDKFDEIKSILMEIERSVNSNGGNGHKYKNKKYDDYAFQIDDFMDNVKNKLSNYEQCLQRLQSKSGENDKIEFEESNIENLADQHFKSVLSTFSNIDHITSNGLGRLSFNSETFKNELIHVNKRKRIECLRVESFCSFNNYLLISDSSDILVFDKTNTMNFIKSIPINYKIIDMVNKGNDSLCLNCCEDDRKFLLLMDGKYEIQECIELRTQSRNDTKKERKYSYIYYDHLNKRLYLIDYATHSMIQFDENLNLIKDEVFSFATDYNYNSNGPSYSLQIHEDSLVLLNPFEKFVYIMDFDFNILKSVKCGELSVSSYIIKSLGSYKSLNYVPIMTGNKIKVFNATDLKHITDLYSEFLDHTTHLFFFDSHIFLLKCLHKYAEGHIYIKNNTILRKMCIL